MTGVLPFPLLLAVTWKVSWQAWVESMVPAAAPPVNAVPAFFIIQVYCFYPFLNFLFKKCFKTDICSGF